MTCSAPTKCKFHCLGGNCKTAICEADTCEQSCTVAWNVTETAVGKGVSMAGAISSVRIKPKNVNRNVDLMRTSAP